ncbi:MAG: GAF domain-containing protein [bacterium]
MKAKSASDFLASIDSRKMLEDVLNNTLEAVFVISVKDNGMFVFEMLNKAYEELTGVKNEEFMAKTPDDILAPIMAVKVKDRYRQCVNERKSIVYEEYLPMKSGRCHWETMLNPIFDASGRVEKIIGFARNIDWRKNLEKENRINEQRLEALLKISQFKAQTNQEFLDYTLEQAIYLTESKIGYIYFYDEEKEEFTLSTWSKGVMNECHVVNPQTKYNLEKTGIWGEAVRQRKPIMINDFSADDPHKKGYPEGHVHISRFLTIPVFINGRIRAVVGVANKDFDYNDKDVLQLRLLMDSMWKISEMRKSQEDLLKTKNQLLEVQKLSKITGWECDLSTGEFTYSEDILDLFGIEKSFEKLTLSELGAFLKPVDAKNFESAIQNLIVNLEPISIEVRFLIRQREYKTLFVKGVCEKENEGKCVKVSGSVQDISSLKEAEERSALLQEQLYQSQKLEALGQLAGGVAHDFNNMLAGIIGNAEMLSLKLMDDQEKQEIAKKIISSSESAANLTKQLLSFSRKGKYQTVAVNLNETIKEVISILEKTIDKKIKIESFLEDKNPFVNGDPVQIENAILNLALNGRDAMPDGGALKFITTCSCEEGFVNVFVEDNGIGMTREVKKHLFEPFFTTKEKGKGTGLGLAGVYGIVKNHGGKITIESEVDKGTSVCITLPAFRGDSSQETSNLGISTKLGFGNIIVIDDEKTIRESTAFVLRKNGYTVFDFEDGKSAVEYFKKEHKTINAVVLDMIMPDMSGKEVFFQLRKIDKNVKVIISSGFSKDGDASDLLTYEYVYFLQKPYRSSLLLNKVEDILQ